MIYTITFNPALDYIVSVTDFKLGMTNRTDSEEMLAGGKGINVSLVLKNLGYDSTALGFIAGFTGEEIRKRVEAQGCKADFITLPQGQSRINVKLKNVDGTEINAAGPEIDEESFRKLMTQLDKLQTGDVLVLAGSIPKSLPGSTYSDIMRTLQEKEILCVVDATGDLLVETLVYKPFLVKPNHHEIGDIFGVKLNTREDVIPYAKKMQEMGAVNVLVSMSAKGAVLVAADGKIYEAAAPEGKVVNAVGAGDSMVAGFLAGYFETGEYEKALLTGLATGSASAFSERLATRSQVEGLLDKMEGFK